jgi:3-oxoadipate enol-lactonase
VTGEATTVAGTVSSVSGDGPPVVMVHGLGLNRAMWQYQQAALSKHFRVIVYDLLGHGESAKPRGAYSMAQMIEQIRALMDELALERAALVGFSLGGLIVQAFTLAHPGRVSALAILNAAHARSDADRKALMARVAQVRENGPASTVNAALERWFTASFADSHPQVLAQVRDWVLANDAQVYPELYYLLSQADIGLEQSISAIACPTLVMTGEQDYGNSADMARRMAALIPGAELEILPGLRHMALMEAPELVNGCLDRFLGRALLDPKP